MICQVQKSYFYRNINQRTREKIYMNKKFKLFDKIISPIVTEKSTTQSEFNKISFKINKNFNKN